MTADAETPVEIQNEQAVIGAGEKNLPPKAPRDLLQCRADLGGITPEHPLTVGAPFKLECPTTSFVLNPSKLKFVYKKPYQLQILKTEMHPDGRLELMVTSYQVGPFPGGTGQQGASPQGGLLPHHGQPGATEKSPGKPDELVLTDGVNELEVQGVEFQVASVIDQQNPPKAPYGPFGGFFLMLPSFYFWSLLGLFITMAAIIAAKSMRRWQRRRLIEGLKKHDSRLGPQTQLHVRFRQLERQRFLEGGEPQKHLAEVEDILRLFVIRQFKIPAYDWSDRLIINDFQKRYAFLGEEMAKELMVLLRETRKSRTLAAPEPKDIEHLVRKIKRWADQADRATGAHGRHAGVSL